VGDIDARLDRAAVDQREVGAHARHVGVGDRDAGVGVELAAGRARQRAAAREALADAGLAGEVVAVALLARVDVAVAALVAAAGVEAAVVGAVAGQGPAGEALGLAGLIAELRGRAVLA